MEGEPPDPRRVAAGAKTTSRGAEGVGEGGCIWGYSAVGAYIIITTIVTTMFYSYKGFKVWELKVQAVEGVWFGV